MSAAPSTPVCVFCRRQPVVHAWRPFCSERCRVQDLGRWADASYRVAGEPADERAVDERINNQASPSHDVPGLRPVSPRDADA